MSLVWKLVQNFGKHWGEDYNQLIDLEFFELQHISMENKSMMQYLSDIKSKCDAIITSGEIVNVEDIILYTLNGLPSSYHAFKIVIRTNLQPISLDDFYSLICSEELNLATKNLRACSLQPKIDQNFALSTCGRGRNRGNYKYSQHGRQVGSSTQRFDKAQIMNKPSQEHVQCQAWAHGSQVLVSYGSHI